jgi:hypothetical protein
LVNGVTYFFGVQAKNAAGSFSTPSYSDGITVQADTILTGVVLEVLTDAPLPNVTLTLVGTGRIATTNSQGQFTFLNLPTGQHTLLLDARTTTVPGQWPIFPIPVTIQEGENTVPTPIWLPELDEENGTVLTTSNFDPTTGQVLQILTVTSPTAPEVKVTIPAGTYMHNLWSPLQLGSILSVTSMPSTKPPMPLLNNVVVGMLVMTQPGGIQFFSDAAMTVLVKVSMEFPNVQNEFQTGTKVSLYSALGGQLGTLVNGGQKKRRRYCWCQADRGRCKNSKNLGRPK